MTDLGSAIRSLLHFTVYSQSYVQADRQTEENSSSKYQ